ncbi:MAG: nicotinate-nucleotide adenylyltransferase [Chitinophagaceae bacterium]|nr:MAG: nicotinate-nucleotide adenylyltransferase [Chitinophagaceae bacterium]
MKIGLYFGSFNPVHHGHLIIANHIVCNTNLDQVWFVVSPQNPLKHSSGLLNEYHRLHLVRLAIEGEDRLRVSDIEFHLPRPSFTIDTLTYLAEKYPKNTFTVIMGSDSYQNIGKWKNHHQLISNYDLLIYMRPGFPVDPLKASRITLLEAPLLEISATYIRNSIKNGKSIRYLLPENVREEIERNRYYF